ncbi:prophage tail length tape measure protein [Roseovarius mucosus]|uniref:Prophage tail length tape measure protein n=1 Tax=Roseovarius mucosus TaxID=215743 RepID=A0A1V0RTB5_9RHOB|nr:phage tail length tape measure family protein [Roseovarius mucosus]ARE85001.1 prophage tail length tape measure protein [Roseovarius mucosus]
MTLRVQGEILMDADQAKAELQATGTAAKGAAQDIRGVGTQGAAAARGVGQLGTAARTSATGLTTASAAADVNAAATQKLSGATRLAAGSMGNLVSQGNDVLVMLAAGQNPFQLAIQQGTQITQVIGPLGAAGAFRALRGAVLSMLSPINLITIGALAATAALVNWFTSASDEGESFADTVEALETRIDSLRDKITEASATRLELAERFGEGFVERAQNILDRIVEAEKRAAQREAAAGITSFLEEGNINLPRPDSGDQVRLAQEFDLGNIFFGRARRESRSLINDVLADLVGLQEAAQGTVEEQAAAVDALIESYTRAAEASGEISEAEQARLDTLDQMRLRLAEVAELQSQDPAQNRQNEEMLAFLELVTKATGEQLKAEAAAQALLSTMLEQNAIAEAIAQHGADSAAVTRLRAQFALNAALAEADASDASVETKDALREAAQAAFEIATSDISGGIRAAADEASRLAAEVRGAVDAMADLQSQGEVGLENARIRAEFRDDPIGRAGALAGARFDRETAVIRGEASGDLATVDALNARRDAVVELARETARLNELARPVRSTSGARGGSTNETLREQQALDRLIESKRREIEALRESDPVQRELIRLRERLTAATPKQREEIEALIAAHENERVALERKEEFGRSVDDVLLEAESLRDVWEGIGDMIIRAAKEALILGTGPLSGLFGGSGGGGFLSGIFGGGNGGALGGLFGLFSGSSSLPFANGGLPAAALPGFASGGDPLVSRPGILLGAGTGRGDKIPALVSAGEFIMTAEATARNRTLLEAMNAGAIIPGFAGGGLPLAARAGGAASAAGGAGAQGNGVTRLRIEPSELFHAVIEERARDMAIEVTKMGIKQFMRDGLPQAVDRINKDPKRRG